MSTHVMRIVAVAVAAFACGCYQYSAAPASTPSTGSVVRLQLTGPGTASLSRVLGRDAVSVDGTILGADDSTFAMSVAATHQRTGEPFTWAGERVVIPRSAVDAIERRSLDRKRTFAVAGLVILGAVAVKLIVSSVDALAGGDDGGTGTVTP